MTLYVNGTIILMQYLGYILPQNRHRDVRGLPRAVAGNPDAPLYGLRDGTGRFAAGPAGRGVLRILDPLVLVPAMPVMIMTSAIITIALLLVGADHHADHRHDDDHHDRHVGGDDRQRDGRTKTPTPSRPKPHFAGDTASAA
jgi:hypothetical protein